LLACSDAVGALLAGAGAALVWVGLLDREPSWWLAALVAILGVAWVLALSGSRSRAGCLRRSLLDDLPKVVERVLLVSAVVALAVAVVSLDPNLAEPVPVAAAVGLVSFAATRGATYALLARAGAPTTSTLSGAGSIGVRVADLLDRRYGSGVEVVGFLDKEPLARVGGAPGSEAPVLGSSYDLGRVIREHGIDRVVVAFSTAPHRRVLEIIWECDRHGVEVSVVPRLFEAITVQSRVENVFGTPLMHLDRIRLAGRRTLLKRAFDLVAASVGLIAISPVLLVVAAMVKLDSPGPILFAQQRVGCDGKRFTLYKFRSMRADAERIGTWTREDDPRQTRVGRFIRAWNLDELPQLVNVLKGDMSLVGPRPEQPSYVELFEQSVYRYTHRHRVKSGITGWAQVNGLRGDTSIEDRVLYDNFYIENWSFWLDLKILFLTFFKPKVPIPERGRDQGCA
jgi:exopolysaccharide biosynthesis polyprenyl glycosylphosphotransferase